MRTAVLGKAHRELIRLYKTDATAYAVLSRFFVKVRARNTKSSSY